MDLEREILGMNDPLRAVFKEAGHHSAPLRMEEAVLARLERSSFQLKASPLIGRTGWFAGGLPVALLILYVVLAPAAPNGTAPYSPDLLQRIGALHVLHAIASPWAIGGLMVIALFMLMDRLIGTRMAPDLVG